MSNLNSFKNLIKSDSFIQINFTKGYGFIDRVGKIINAYHNKQTPPVVNDISPAGLTLSKFDPNIDTIRISNNFFWVKFLPKNITYKTWIRYFISELKKVQGIVEFEKINRIGWRNYLVLEYPDEEYEKRIEKKFSFDSELKFVTNTYTTKIKSPLITQDIDIFKLLKDNKTNIKYLDFVNTIRFEKVMSNKGDNKNGLLIDIDLFCEKEINFVDVETYLNSFLGYLETGLIDLINKL